MTDTLELFGRIKSIPDKWPAEFRDKLKLEYLPVFYPEGRQDMISMFKPCCTARLFAPHMLANEDAIIYIDTDFIFLAPPEELWNQFSKFQNTELVSMGSFISEHDESKRNMVCAHQILTIIIFSGGSYEKHYFSCLRKNWWKALIMNSSLWPTHTIVMQ